MANFLAKIGFLVIVPRSFCFSTELISVGRVFLDLKPKVYHESADV